ncbi:MAG: hypothetical protein AB7Q42_12925 [Acidimicrobiia bacterium]
MTSTSTTLTTDVRSAGRPPRLGRSHLVELADRLTAAELYNVADEIRTRVDRMGTINASIVGHVADVDQTRTRVVLAIAAGDLTPADAALELDDVVRQNAVGPLSSQLAEQAVAQLCHFVAAYLHAAGDGMIRSLDELVQESAAKITTAVKITDAAGITDDTAAVRATPEAAAAWSLMVAETERVEACWNAASLLRQRQLVPTLRRDPSTRGAFFEWRNQDALADVQPPRRPAVDHPAHKMARRILAGAQPAVLTAIEAAGLYLR